MFTIAFGIVLAVILLATIEYWLPVVFWICVTLMILAVLIFVTAVVVGAE